MRKDLVVERKATWLVEFKLNGGGIKSYEVDDRTMSSIERMIKDKRAAIEFMALGENPGWVVLNRDWVVGFRNKAIK